MQKQTEDYSNVTSWSSKAVARWIASIGYPDYGDKFVDHAIDGAVLLQLSEDDLFTILPTPKLGHVKKICNQITKLRNNALQFSKDWEHSKFTDRKEYLRYYWKREFFERLPKLLVGIGFLLIICFLTSFTMAVVHDRVPGTLFLASNTTFRLHQVSSTS